MDIIYTIDQLPADIIRSIHNQLNFIDQCNLRLVSTYFTMYQITNLLDNVPNVTNLTDAICQSYPMCTKLNAVNNNNITNVNHLVNLIELNINNNNKITDFSHLINLQILYCKGKCKMFMSSSDDDEKLINLNHLINLRILHCVGDCEIDNNSISRLTNLTELNCSKNEYITNINHLVNLKILRAEDKCGIDNNGFELLTNLTKLDSSGNKKILIGTRYFNAFSETGDIIGKCGGQTPMQAASQMYSKITNSAKANGTEIDIDKPIIVRLKETTYLSFEKKYDFTCIREKLDEPQQVTTVDKVTGEPKTIIYEYKLIIKLR
jgi:hypothetical protein